MKEPEYIICMPRDINQNTSNSMDTNCSICDALLGITPASLQIMSESGAKPICISCVCKRSGDEFNVMLPTKEQLEEMERELRK